MAVKRRRSARSKQSGLNLIAYVPYALTTIAIIVAYLVFIPISVIYTFLCFIILVPIFVYFRFDGRIPFGFAILTLLIAAAVLTSYTKEALSNHFVVLSFWLLVVGMLCLIIDYLRNGKR